MTEQRPLRRARLLVLPDDHDLFAFRGWDRVRLNGAGECRYILVNILINICDIYQTGAASVSIRRFVDKLIHDA